MERAIPRSKSNSRNTGSVVFALFALLTLPVQLEAGFNRSVFAANNGEAAVLSIVLQSSGRDQSEPVFAVWRDGRVIWNNGADGIRAAIIPKIEIENALKNLPDIKNSSDKEYRTFGSHQSTVVTYASDHKTVQFRVGAAITDLSELEKIRRDQLEKGFSRPMPQELADEWERLLIFVDNVNNSLESLESIDASQYYLGVNHIPCDLGLDSIVDWQTTYFKKSNGHMGMAILNNIVRAVKKGSIADRAGVKYGYKMLGINGNRFDDWLDDEIAKGIIEGWDQSRKGPIEYLFRNQKGIEIRLVFGPNQKNKGQNEKK